MTRERSAFAALGFLLATAPLMFSQDSQSRPSPALPTEILGPQLIVWSQAQKPQPIPQPLPPPDRPVQQQQDAQQPGQSQPTNPPQDQGREKSAQQTFTGTIIKDGAKYVLKGSGDTEYQLNDQDVVKGYEGKQVKLIGTLDPDGHSIHVVRVELIS